MNINQPKKELNGVLDGLFRTPCLERLSTGTPHPRGPNTRRTFCNPSFSQGLFHSQRRNSDCSLPKRNVAVVV
ncbi:hypothetical protein TNCV_730461 [Trichonephila clavipes]|nr:hypothetical protein TNCV_730461 [Trichonephila clavipes]